MNPNWSRGKKVSRRSLTSFTFDWTTSRQAQLCNSGSYPSVDAPCCYSRFPKAHNRGTATTKQESDARHSKQESPNEERGRLQDKSYRLAVHVGGGDEGVGGGGFLSRHT